MNNFLISNYRSDFVCTYRHFSNDYSDICYRTQLLQAFDLNTYDYEKLYKKIDTLYNVLRENKEITNILEILSKHYNITNNISNDKIIIFQILLSYDYFDIFHKCLSIYLHNKLINNPFKELETFILNNK